MALSKEGTGNWKRKH